MRRRDDRPLEEFLIRSDVCHKSVRLFALGAFMPSSKTKESKKSQRQRFIDAAREAGASEDEAVFDENLKSGC